ncbi:hypothetical protein PENSPDRAFT_754286 [Peniophora sp. CONT]|nr:hypothetical protein PENSPDRAFT_754286 [Peniophora sp. CONT]
MTDFTTLQDDRTYLAEEVGNYIVYCCKADTWLDYYEVHFADETINHVYNALVEKGRISPEHGWRFLLRQAGTEDVTFASLKEIALDIIHAACQHDRNFRQTCVAVPTPRSTVLLETPGYRFIPDWRRQPTAKYSNQGIDSVNIGELKLEDDKDGKNRRDNEMKSVSDANHLLYNDPRRTSVSGMTIEGCVLRLWHFNRSRIAKSVDIDLTKNPRALIIYLLFSMTASKEKLGFDKTIERIPIGNGVCFRIELDGALYETIGPPLFDGTAFKLVGRATRV